MDSDWTTRTADAPMGKAYEPPRTDQQLTVRQLIAELEKMPQDTLVEVEGCDCYQDAEHVTDHDDYVLIGHGPRPKLNR